MIINFKRCTKTLLMLGTTAMIGATMLIGPSVTMAKDQERKPKETYSLTFNNSNYTKESVTVNGQTVRYRSYENIVYVSKPVDPNYQIMNIYIPEIYFESAYKERESAPIFFPNTIGGYNQAKPAPVTRPSISLALSKGYVVATPGARGRTTQNENGLYTGKAPAGIVDLKAAVRYLRYNDKIMPGNAEKIISNGTSAGGAMSALLGATGNNKDYEPYLQELGAAKVRDDVYAVSSYCPITNLENADTAYEWLFNGINSYHWRESGQLTPEQIEISDELKALFPSYVNSLNLVENRKANKKGDRLSLRSNGEGPFKEYLESFVIQSAQTALNNGANLSNHSFLTIKKGKVIGLDFSQFLEYATRMKTPPAFDSLSADSFENSLFGTSVINTKHFTRYSFANSQTDSYMANSKIIKMMNPMNYISTKNTTTSKHWRIRHGAIDRDTSLAIPVILATKLENKGYNVDFALPWDTGHSGDYDLEELFSWMDKVVKERRNNL